MKFYYKSLSLKNFKSIISINNNKNRYTMFFNNCHVYDNSYSFDYKLNTMFFSNIYNINEKELIYNVKGIDRKIECIDNFNINKFTTSIKINSHYDVKFLSSIENIINDYFLNYYKKNSIDTRLIKNIFNNNNLILALSMYLIQLDNLINNNSSINKNEIIINLKKYIIEYLKYVEELISISELKEELIQSKINSKIKFYCIISCVISLIWILLFYILIYKVYSWDVIEPISFLASMGLLIFQLLLFIKYKKKIGIETFFNKDFFDKLYLIEKHNLNYSKSLKASLISEKMKTNIVINYLNTINNSI